MPATERPRRSAAPRAPAPFAAMAGNASESVVRKGAERPRLHWDRLRHAMVDPVLQARVECDLRLAQAPRRPGRAGTRLGRSGHAARLGGGGTGPGALTRARGTGRRSMARC